MKTLNAFTQFVVLVSLPLLLGGCNQSSSVLKYEIHGDNVTITDCEVGTSGELVIPATFEGKTVTSIGFLAFAACTSLTSITIPDSVTSIGSSAFEDCNILTVSPISGIAPSLGAAP